MDTPEKRSGTSSNTSTTADTDATLSADGFTATESGGCSSYLPYFYSQVPFSFICAAALAHVCGTLRLDLTHVTIPRQLTVTTAFTDFAHHLPTTYVGTSLGWQEALIVRFLFSHKHHAISCFVTHTTGLHASLRQAFVLGPVNGGDGTSTLHP